MAEAHSIEAPIHRDDITSQLGLCSGAFLQIAAILRAAQAHLDKPATPDLKHLVQAAHHLAEDHANLSGCWSEEVDCKGVRNE